MSLYNAEEVLFKKLNFLWKRQRFNKVYPISVKLALILDKIVQQKHPFSKLYISLAEWGEIKPLGAVSVSIE